MKGDTVEMTKEEVRERIKSITNLCYIIYTGSKLKIMICTFFLCVSFNSGAVYDHGFQRDEHTRANVFKLVSYRRSDHYFRHCYRDYTFGTAVHIQTSSTLSSVRTGKEFWLSAVFAGDVNITSTVRATLLKTRMLKKYPRKRKKKIFLHYFPYLKEMK